MSEYKVKVFQRESSSTSGNGSYVEFESFGDEEGFVTAGNKGDTQATERVVIITPRQALKLAAKLTAFANKYLAKV